LQRDDLVTTDLPTGQPATRPVRRRVRAAAFRLLCCASLCVAGTLPAFAQSANDAPVQLDPIQLDATVLDTVATAQPATQSTTRVRPIFGDLAELDSAAVEKAVQKPAISDRIQNVLAKAITLLGTPYRWGGESTDGFDCSGLVGYVYRSVLGMELPRVSRQMVKSGEAVERAALAPGDLVFFGLRGRVTHVGIYVGEGRFLHAPSRGKDVRVDSLVTGYWSGRYMQGRRVAM
jgi:cell wall-associated NlpC family hydrolase